jgi:hypothetical protein
VSESGQPPAEGSFGAPPGASQRYREPDYRPQGFPQQAYPEQAFPEQAFPEQAYPGYPAYQPGGPGYAGYPPASTAPFPVGTLVLLVVSVLSLIATGILGIPSAVVSIVAWRRNVHDPRAARRLTLTGWIVYGVNFALAVPLLIWFYIWALDNQ